MARKVLVEVGVVLVALGVILLVAPNLLAYRDVYPLAVACIGLAVMSLGFAMAVAPPRAALAFKALASALVVVGFVLIVLGVVGAPLALLSFPVGPGRSFNYVTSGPLEDRVVRLEVRNAIGRTSVMAWDSDEYMVNVTLRVYALTWEQAERIAETHKPRVVVERAGGKTVIRVELNYRVEIPVFITYDVIVMLPKRASVELALLTTTGEVGVEGLRVAEAALRATTGRIALRDVTASTLNATATTGEIEAVLDAERASFSVTTGEVNVRIIGSVSGEYVLSATTGEVNVEVPDKPDVGVRLVATSTLGDIDYPGHWVTEMERGRVSTTVVARTPNFDEAQVKITLRAKVTTGDVEVTQG